MQSCRTQLPSASISPVPRRSRMYTYKDAAEMRQMLVIHLNLLLFGKQLSHEAVSLALANLLPRFLEKREIQRLLAAPDRANLALPGADELGEILQDRKIFDRRGRRGFDHLVPAVLHLVQRLDPRGVESLPTLPVDGGEDDCRRVPADVVVPSLRLFEKLVQGVAGFGCLDGQNGADRVDVEESLEELALVPPGVAVWQE